MGMFDYIKGHTRCGYCGNLHEIDEQTKIVDREERTLGTYIVGDFIPLSDGKYNLEEYTCDVCENKNVYSLIVKKGKLKRFETEQQSQEEKIRVSEELIVKACDRRDAFFKEIAEIKERNKLNEINL